MQIPYARLPSRSLIKTSRPGPRTRLPHVELAGRRAALVASDEDNAAVLRALQACVHVLGTSGQRSGGTGVGQCAGMSPEDQVQRLVGGSIERTVAHPVAFVFIGWRRGDPDALEIETDILSCFE